MIKKVLLILAMASAFLFGYGAHATAVGVPDRNAFFGYFYNVYDSAGADVLRGGIWTYDVNSFINHVKNQLYGGDGQNRTGANFLVQTMIGLSRNRPPTAAEMADWEARVRYADSRGLVFWNVWINYGINSLWQGEWLGPNPPDDTFYYENGGTFTIAFVAPNGHLLYTIKHDCANPLGNIGPLEPAPQNYNLVPTVQASKSAALQGDVIVFSYFVRNAGVDNSPSVGCKTVGNDRPSGYSPLPQQDADRFSDPGYGDPPESCPQVFVANSTVQVAVELVVVGSQEPGSKICRSLVVNPKDAAGGPRASAEVCVVVAKGPYVHFQGGDVWAGGGFADVNPSCDAQSKIVTNAKRLSDGSNAGSAVEYAAYALGQIVNFGSGSKSRANPAEYASKQLTFANSDPDNSKLGYFGASSHCIDDYLAQYDGLGDDQNTIGSNINLATTPGSSVVRRLNGNHTIHGTLRQNTQYVFIVEGGNVTITDDIKYPDTYDSGSEIPSLTIIVPNGNINVQSDVRRMDGFFITKQKFVTCIPPGGPLSVNNCNLQLVVNGAVIAQSIDFNRTFGADGPSSSSRKQPGEIFNFVPEIYIRSGLYMTQCSDPDSCDNARNSIITQSLLELPPRF